VTRAFWPARMQRLRHGPLADSAPGVELWLDGGHNPAGGEAVAATLARMPARETHLICGMLNTKDVRGYMRPLAPQAARLWAVSIPGEKNTLPAEVPPAMPPATPGSRPRRQSRWPARWPPSPRPTPRRAC
jgi:dihydrofolate synthase/folylpolyglutamate synthase